LLRPESRNSGASIVTSVLHVGIDDTDSPRKGCTTYVAALLVDKLAKSGCVFVDYPNLIRLNPNVPWKTRGNGAVCLRFVCTEQRTGQVMKSIISIVRRNSDLTHKKADPAIAYLRGDVPAELTEFSKKVIRSVATTRDAERIARKCNVSHIALKGKKGIIGATAAIGETLRSDHTYELIAYRTPQNRSHPRRIDKESIFTMNQETAPLTFNNVDPETGRVLITPRGRDPILYGIRGETAEAVLKGHQIVGSNEEIERWVIFRTNHGTDDHYSKVSKITDVRPHQPAVVIARVSSIPRTIPGGHVIFELSDGSAAIDCAAYEPTGHFRDIIRKLVQGDVVEACGGVRKQSKTCPQTLNLEKIRILSLAPNSRHENPCCPKCGKRMESAGRGQGFRCRRCSVLDPTAQKTSVTIERDLSTGLYVPPPRAHRHLTKPISRYGREKIGQNVCLIESWHRP